MNTRAFGIAAVAAAATGWPALPPPLPAPPLVGISVPSQEAIVAPEQAGKIVQLPFAEGDQVAKDQVIFKLNSRLEELEVERLRPIVESDLARRRAELSLEHALQQERRVRDLRDQQIASDVDLIERTHEVELARLRLKQAELEAGQAQNQLAQAREKLEQRSVKSPFAGIVTQRFKSEGESVERFAPVIEVMNLDPLWIEFDCPVQDRGKFRLGNQVPITPSYDPDDERIGTVIHLSLKATASSHTFLIRAAVPNRDLTWRAGQKMLIGEPIAAEAAPAARPGK